MTIDVNDTWRPTAFPISQLFESIVFLLFFCIDHRNLWDNDFLENTSAPCLELFGHNVSQLEVQVFCRGQSHNDRAYFFSKTVTSVKCDLPSYSGYVRGSLLIAPSRSPCTQIPNTAVKPTVMPDSAVLLSGVGEVPDDIVVVGLFKCFCLVQNYKTSRLSSTMRGRNEVIVGSLLLRISLSLFRFLLLHYVELRVGMVELLFASVTGKSV